MKTQNDTITFSDGYDLLVKEGENPAPRPQIKQGRLLLSEIRRATSVFQPRTGRGSMGWSAGHKASLATALRNSPSRELDPVVVWWSGKYWRVVDGHHRLDAYLEVSNPVQPKAKGKRRRSVVPIATIPVEVFDGTLNEAIAYAVGANSKNKLAMTQADKLETAWRMTTLDAYSITQISKATTVAEKTVSNMRKAMRDIAELNKGQSEPAKVTGDFGEGVVNPREITWAKAKALLLGEREIDDHWVEKQVKDWARKLAQAFGDKLGRNPGLTQLALETYSRGLTKKIVEIWQEEQGEEPPESDDPEDDEDQDEVEPEVAEV